MHQCVKNDYLFSVGLLLLILLLILFDVLYVFESKHVFLSKQKDKDPHGFLP